MLQKAALLMNFKKQNHGNIRQRVKRKYNNKNT